MSDRGPLYSFHDLPPSQFVEAAKAANPTDELAALRAKLGGHQRAMEIANQQLARADDRLAALRAENARLREALTDIADKDRGLWSGNRARAALSGKGTGE